MIQARGLIIVALLLFASLGLAEQSADVVLVEEAAVTARTSVIVQRSASVASSTVAANRPPDIRELREDDPAKAAINVAKARMLFAELRALPWMKGTPEWGPYPHPSTITQVYGEGGQGGESGLDIDAVHATWRYGWTWWKNEHFGIHLEKCKAGNWVASTFTMGVTEYVDRPVVHTLGPCPAPQYRQPVTWQAKINDAPCKISKIRPAYVAAYMPVAYQTPGNGPMGGENKVSIQRTVPDLTMLVYGWIASRWFRCSCGHSHTGTCPEGGQPIDGPGGGDLINTGPPVPPVPGQRN